MSDPIKILSWDGGTDTPVLEAELPNDTRYTPHVIIDSPQGGCKALLSEDDLPSEAILVDGRLIQVGYFAMGRDYSLLEASDHPYLREKGLIHSDDSIESMVTLDGLLIHSAWIENVNVRERFTYVHLDPFNKVRAFDQKGDYVTIDVLNWMAELPLYVPGRGGFQFRVWLHGELSHTQGMINLDVVQVKVIGEWVADTLYPIDRTDYTPEQLEGLRALEQYVVKRKPIAGYRVKAQRVFSANVNEYFKRQKA